MSAHSVRKSSKWIPGAFPEAPVTAVARRALQLRLAAVVNAIGPAAKHAEEDNEHVHQLRVATRRAAAAIEIFGDLAPKRRVKWIAKRLRHIRRAAGAARDLDVFAFRLAALLAQEKHVDAVPLIKSIRRERRKAQVPICEVYHELRRDKFERRCQKLVRRVRRRDAAGEDDAVEPISQNGHGSAAAHDVGMSFASAARLRLRPVVEQVFALIDVADQPIEAWHRLRIEAKRLRYAMELFAGAFDASFRHEVYPQVEALQEQLGKINDHASAATRFAAWQEEMSSLTIAAWLDKQRAAEEAACRKCQQQFLADWPADRLTALKQALERQLSLPASIELPAPPESEASPAATAELKVAMVHEGKIEPRHAGMG